MIKYLLKLTSFGFILFFLQQGVCSAVQEYSSSQLLRQENKLNGQIIEFEGEVVGGIMPRGAYAWVNLNDGENAIGVWCPLELTSKITYIGDYKHRGDRLKVIGQFQGNCQEHGGVLDIHAQSADVVQDGSCLEHKVSVFKVDFAFGIMCLAIISGFWALIKKRR